MFAHTLRAWLHTCWAGIPRQLAAAAAAVSGSMDSASASGSERPIDSALGERPTGILRRSQVVEVVPAPQSSLCFLASGIPVAARSSASCDSYVSPLYRVIKFQGQGSRQPTESLPVVTACSDNWLPCPCL